MNDGDDSYFSEGKTKSSDAAKKKKSQQPAAAVSAVRDKSQDKLIRPAPDIEFHLIFPVDKVAEPTTALQLARLTALNARLHKSLQFDAVIEYLVYLIGLTESVSGEAVQKRLHLHKPLQFENVSLSCTNPMAETAYWMVELGKACLELAVYHFSEKFKLACSADAEELIQIYADPETRDVSWDYTFRFCRRFCSLAKSFVQKFESSWNLIHKEYATMIPIQKDVCALTETASIRNLAVVVGAVIQTTHILTTPNLKQLSNPALINGCAESVLFMENVIVSWKSSLPGEMANLFQLVKLKRLMECAFGYFAYKVMMNDGYPNDAEWCLSFAPPNWFEKERAAATTQARTASMSLHPKASSKRDRPKLINQKWFDLIKGEMRTYPTLVQANPDPTFPVFRFYLNPSVGAALPASSYAACK